MLSLSEFLPLKISNLTLPVWLGFIMSQREIFRAEFFQQVLFKQQEVWGILLEITEHTNPVFTQFLGLV